MRFVGTALIAGTIGVFFLLADGGWMRAGTEGSTNLVAAPAQKTAKFGESEPRFEQVVGRTVENVDGEKLGIIKDLVLQRQTGRIQYVLVKSNGLIGRRRTVLVPISAIALSTAKAAIASVDLSKQEWKRAPGFRKEDLALLAEPGRAKSVARFYEKTEVPRDSQNPGPQAPQLSSTGHKTGRTETPAGNNGLELASDVVGKN